ncbi:MAG: DinB family protein [Pseudomonadota bacterium]
MRAFLDAVQALPEDEFNVLYIKHNAGKHLRHVFDHVSAFLESLHSGELDYDKRSRGSLCEVDCDVASALIDDLLCKLERASLKNRPLKVLSEIDTDETVRHRFDSNTDRELLYLINHTIHHAAHLQLLAKQCGIELPVDMGVSPATASFRRQSAC